MVGRAVGPLAHDALDALRAQGLAPDAGGLVVVGGGHGLDRGAEVGEEVQEEAATLGVPAPAYVSVVGMCEDVPHGVGRGQAGGEHAGAVDTARGACLHRGEIEAPVVPDDGLAVEHGPGPQCHASEREIHPRRGDVAARAGLEPDRRRGAVERDAVAVELGLCAGGQSVGSRPRAGGSVRESARRGCRQQPLAVTVTSLGWTRSQVLAMPPFSTSIEMSCRVRLYVPSPRQRQLSRIVVAPLWR